MTTRRKPRNRRFVSNAIHTGDLTPAERSARKAWLENSHARERQLVDIAGQTLRGYAEAPLREKEPE